MDIPITIRPTPPLPPATTTIPQKLPFSSQGAEVILGNILKAEQLVIPVAPSPTTMFGLVVLVCSQMAYCGCQIQDIIDYWDGGIYRLKIVNLLIG